ncbi:hypothetical protein Poly30_56430 [Planctomycetes bacterium Poly30]|uniref:MetA-pathway of phenol degradation n=1 Tax=Saltatorellus ferox TaxID=2528018 RepID=A0A518F164_9BACT|nr:hypothetical protein Poly30_56430 [Planctomycetes bacterium Poly30]
MNSHSILKGAALAALCCSCAATLEQADLTPTPQRPRISKNTKTTTKDSVELEAGLTWDPNDFVDTPATFKYGFSETTEVIVETAPLRRYEVGNETETGIGDLAFGFRHRFEPTEDGAPTFGMEFVGKLPTNDSSDESNFSTGGRDPRTSILGAANTGSTDLTLAGIVEQQQGDISVVGYGAINAFGSGVSGTLYQMLLASHAAMPLTDADTVFAELAWALNESVPDTAILQGGIYRRVGANMTADAALGLGLNGDSPGLFFMVGLSTNFGYLR